MKKILIHSIILGSTAFGCFWGGVVFGEKTAPKTTFSDAGWEITGVVAPGCPNDYSRNVYPDSSGSVSISCEIK